MKLRSALWFGGIVLNYAVTLNHDHLLLVGDDDRDVIPNSIKLIAGRTGQKYNQRKNRKGAFWEDRYHATTVESGGHLFKCLVYIDLNIVRAGMCALIISASYNLSVDIILQLVYITTKKEKL